jgi:DNA-binding CsgD family transcriptional regulator
MPLTERDKYKGIFHLVSKGVIKEHTAEVNLFTSRYKILQGSVHCRMINDFSGIIYVLGVFDQDSKSSQNLEVRQADPDAEMKKNLQTNRQTRLKAENKSEPEIETSSNTLETEEKVLVKEMFSTRELEVLSMAARGLSTKEIADKLFISDRTVEKHRANMMAKISAANIVEVIIYAVKNDLICV